MKKVMFAIFILACTAQLTAQTKTTLKTTKKDVQIFAEFSPFLAGFQLVSIAGGVEFDRYQIGVGFSKGTHNFTHGLAKTTFSNFGTLHFLHDQTEEIFVKRYFKQNRKGFYIGLLFNLTHWQVQNEAQKVNVNSIGKYVTVYGGYRWFPGKKNDVFYIEPNFGISARLNGKQLTQVGDQSFSYLQPPFELTPNIYTGARFRLRK